MPSVQVNKKIAISFIGFSFIASVLYSYLLSFTERGLPPLDWFSIVLNIIWFCVLAWVAWDIYKDKPRVEGVILFLACLVGLLTGFDLFEEDGSLLLAGVSIVEALFLVAAYFLLRSVRRKEVDSEESRLTSY